MKKNAPEKFLGHSSSILHLPSPLGLRWHRRRVRSQFSFEPFRLGLVLAERRFQALEGVRGWFLAALMRLVHGVAEGLRGFVGELADAKELEPDLPFIDRSARGLACAAEFGGQFIPESHAILPRWLTLPRLRRGSFLCG